MRPTYRLSWVNRVDGELVFHLSGVATVGRSSDNEIAIDEEGVSRHHCRLEVRDERLLVRDLGSTNGTFVNGRRTAEAVLSPGDELLIGRSLLRVTGGQDEDPLGRTRAIGAATIQVALEAAHAEYPGDLTGSTRAVDHLRTLCRVIDAINAGGAPEDLYRTALEAVLDTLGMEDGAVVLGDDAASAPAVQVARGGGTPRPPSRTVLGRVLLTGEAVLADDVAADARWRNATSLVGQAESKIVCAPIAVAGRVAGALYFASSGAGPSVGESELRLVTMVARQLALAAENLHRAEVLREENRALRADAGGGLEIVGESAALARVLEVARRAAAADATVLVTGETGTGKELVARAIHSWSRRHDGPFVAINCGAIPATMVESELFGHEKGAFTGATERRIGRFEMAHGGTLLLDEIGELPPDVQVKLLRVLEEKKFFRVGGSKEIAVDARVVAATNRDLDRRVAEGTFRQDLLYRLRVLEIVVPPLRARPEDVRPLAEALLGRLAARAGRPRARLAEDALQRLEAYAWPGNVRELRNVLERALILCASDTIRADDVLPAGAVERRPETSPEPAGTDEDVKSMRDAERDAIRAALEATGWNKSKAAELLGIGRTNIYEKIKLYGLSPEG